MKKHFLLWLFALVFAVQTPFILAISCSELSLAVQPTCYEIQNADLTSVEKDLLISNLEYNNKFFPDHDYVAQ
jgi:hypothetical protein